MQALFSHLIVHRCKILNKALLYKQLFLRCNCQKATHKFACLSHTLLQEHCNQMAKAVLSPTNSTALARR